MRMVRPGMQQPTPRLCCVDAQSVHEALAADLEVAQHRLVVLSRDLASHQHSEQEKPVD